MKFVKIWLDIDMGFVRGGVTLSKGVGDAERVRVLEENRWGSTFFGIVMKMGVVAWKRAICGL